MVFRELPRISPSLLVSEGDARFAGDLARQMLAVPSFWIRRSELARARKVVARAGLGPSQLSRYGSLLSDTAASSANARYLDSRLGDPALSQLNPDQRRAAIIDEDRSLVLAGAGTGKTHTMLARVHDLVRRGQVRPGEVAFVTFTNKAATEIRERSGSLQGMEVGTIHHLARTVLRHLLGGRVTTSPLARNAQHRFRSIRDWLIGDDGCLRSDPTLVLALRTRIDAASVSDRGADPVRERLMHVLHLCEFSPQCPVFPLPVSHTPRFPDGYRPFAFLPDRPDEGLDPAANPHSGVWIDYFESTTDPRRLAHQEAIVQLHALMGTRSLRLVEADAFLHTNDLVDLLLDELSHYFSRRVSRPRFDQVLDSMIRLERREIASVVREIDAWLHVSRQGVDPFDSLFESPAENGVPFESFALYELAHAVLPRYLRELEHSATLDHESTILSAREALDDPALRDVPLPWRAVIVDEWQDVNPAQSAFIHSLSRRRGPGGSIPRLTVVGDDWQAIFGFQGGDVSLIRAFEDPAGLTPTGHETTVLRQTYRFGPRIADTARAFITAVPDEQDKVVVGAVSAPEPDYACFQLASASWRHDPPAEDRDVAESGMTWPLLLCLNRLHGIWGQSSALVLARRNVDVMDRTGTVADRVRRLLTLWESSPARLPSYLVGAVPAEVQEDAVRRASSQAGFDHARIRAWAADHGWDVESDTVHRAKGREADFVIFLDSSSRLSPQAEAERRALERGLSVLRPRWDPAGEERRIWYVGLTRSRAGVVILVPDDSSQHSFEIDELWRNESGAYDVGEDLLAELMLPVVPMQPCPVCAARGLSDRVLVPREGTYRPFVGCSGYSSGLDACGHSERRCTRCHVGIMMRVSSTEALCREPGCSHRVPLCRCRTPKPMVIRTNSRDGTQFYGCQSYRPGSTGTGHSCGHTLDLESTALA